MRNATQINNRSRQNSAYRYALDSSRIHMIPHTPVLTNELLHIFKPIHEGILIDCTLGFGGHAHALLQNHSRIKILGIDKDGEAREFATRRLAKYTDRFQCLAGGFKDIFPQLLERCKGQIRGVLADIGVSSYQLDTPRRGFGFESSCLDMRMDSSQKLSAQDILLDYPPLALERIFRNFGELQEAKALADKICALRGQQPEIFQNASSFSHFLRAHFKNPKILPLVYQSLRIEVNGELEELESLLAHAKDLQDCILCVISFHSLEDRMVKNYFKHYATSCICPPEALKCSCGSNHAKGKILTKKPLVAQNAELAQNPRARSAKLRAFYFY